jgi:hypothetical protein
MGQVGRRESRSVTERRHRPSKFADVISECHRAVEVWMAAPGWPWCRIRDAARRLFVEHGYVATTIEASVAVPTVYLAFGTKRALLAELLDIACVGDKEPVAVLERPWVDEVRHDPDP